MTNFYVRLHFTSTEPTDEPFEMLRPHPPTMTRSLEGVCTSLSGGSHCSSASDSELLFCWTTGKEASEPICGVFSLTACGCTVSERDGSRRPAQNPANKEKVSIHSVSVWAKKVLKRQKEICKWGFVCWSRCVSVPAHLHVFMEGVIEWCRTGLSTAGSQLGLLRDEQKLHRGGGGMMPGTESGKADCCPTEGTGRWETKLSGRRISCAHTKQEERRCGCKSKRERWERRPLGAVSNNLAPRT